MPSKALRPSVAGSGCHSGAAWAGGAVHIMIGTARASAIRREIFGIVGVSFLTSSSAGVHIGRRTDPANRVGHPMSGASKLEGVDVAVNGRSWQLPLPPQE